MVGGSSLPDSHPNSLLSGSIQSTSLLLSSQILLPSALTTYKLFKTCLRNPPTLPLSKTLSIILDSSMSTVTGTLLVSAEISK